MRVDDNEERSGLSRRRALRLLAASAGATAAGSTIISQPAYADSGSETCRFDFTGSPTVTVVTTNSNGNSGDQCTVNVTGVNGSCPCGGRATIEYAYFFTIPDLGTGGTGWISSPGVFVTNNPIWPNEGGSVTVGVGVRVTCVADGRTAIRCRFGSQSFPVGKKSSLTRSFSLPTNNGNGAPPTGIPACDSAALRSAALFAPSSAGGSVWVAPGFQAPIAVDSTASDPVVDLGPVEAPTDPTTTTATTTTEPPPPSTAAPTTTSTTTTTPTTTTATTTTTAPSVTTSSTTITTTAAPVVD